MGRWGVGKVRGRGSLLGAVAKGVKERRWRHAYRWATADAVTAIVGHGKFLVWTTSKRTSGL